MVARLEDAGRLAAGHHRAHRQAPASAFADVNRSGLTGVSSKAHSVPVRPMPHWISSKTSSAPERSHASRAAISMRSEIGHTPVSP